MRLIFRLVPLLFVVTSAAQGSDGLITVQSAFSASETMARLEGQVNERGLTIFARVDHAAGAERVGQSLRPTELLIFGHPKGGTPFMECAQTVGIDLPLKALVWEDEAGRVWLGYNDPAYVAARHGVEDCPVVGKLAKVLAGLAEASARP